MKPEAKPISEAFALIVELAEALGVAHVNRLPGCWEHRFGDWAVAVNGHRESIWTPDGLEVPPYHARVEHNGWPAAFLAPFGGTIFGGLENAICAALTAEIARVRETLGVGT